jgi:hypothetical protein
MHKGFTCNYRSLVRKHVKKQRSQKCANGAQETSTRNPFQYVIMTFYYNLQSTVCWCTLVLFSFDSFYKHSSRQFGIYRSEFYNDLSFKKHHEWHLRYFPIQYVKNKLVGSKA